MTKELSVTSTIESRIFTIRDQKVMIDRDLAELYEVEVKYLNRAVKRNITRFPSDFMFQLTDNEWEHLRYQIGTAKMVGKIRYNPYVFTEQGIAMLSGLLNSEIAIKVNIQIMRIFVKLRHYALTKPDTNAQIVDLRKLLLLHIENTDNKFSKHDKKINEIVMALNSLIEQPKPFQY